MDVEWKDIKHIEEFREHYEFNMYAVLVDDRDSVDYQEGYTVIVFGINHFPKNTKRFCLIPADPLDI